MFKPLARSCDSLQEPEFPCWQKTAFRRLSKMIQLEIHPMKQRAASAVLPAKTSGPPVDHQWEHCKFRTIECKKAGT